MIHSAQLEQQAIDLRLKGYSLLEISQKLNIAKSTTSVWLKNINLTKKAKIILHKKKAKPIF